MCGKYLESCGHVFVETFEECNGERISQVEMLGDIFDRVAAEAVLKIVVVCVRKEFLRGVIGGIASVEAAGRRNNAELEKLFFLY